MSFRIPEISNPSELYIRHHQIHILQEGKEIKVPLEDLLHIFCIGPDIRISTKDLSILSQNKISLVTLDEKYLPTAIVLPMKGSSRQAKLMHEQINKSNQWKRLLDILHIFQMRMLIILNPLPLNYIFLIIIILV